MRIWTTPERTAVLFRTPTPESDTPHAGSPFRSMPSESGIAANFFRAHPPAPHIQGDTPQAAHLGSSRTPLPQDRSAHTVEQDDSLAELDRELMNSPKIQQLLAQFPDIDRKELTQRVHGARDRVQGDIRAVVAREAQWLQILAERRAEQELHGAADRVERQDLSKKFRQGYGRPRANTVLNINTSGIDVSGARKPAALGQTPQRPGLRQTRTFGM